jgi:hypothetical protein
MPLSWGVSAKMAEVVYILCGATSILCAVLLFRSYLASRARLLFWSSLCFVGLALNNVLLILDLYVVSTDLFYLRTLIALAAMAMLIYGLIWSSP